MHASTRPLRRPRTGILAALTVALGSLAFAGTASANYRELPNNGCPADTPQADFDDRGAAHEVHRRNVDCVASQGIALGEAGRFLPAESVRRDQMASFVARTLESAGDRDLPNPSDQGFDDIEGNVHADRINQLAEIGVVEGRSADEYDPASSVTRAQMASYLVRAASWDHDTEYVPAAEGVPFADIDDPTHLDAIGAGYELYLLEGRSADEYAPTGDVRRDQMATFLTRLLDLVHREQWENSNQTFAIAPQEVLTFPAGEPSEYEVLLRYGDEPFTGPVDLALFPCGDDPADLPLTLADGDGDGVADNLGSTDTGQAYISNVNGEPLMGPELHVSDVVPDEDGNLTFELVSPAPDCAVAVVFGDRVPEDQLRVDAGNRPAGPYGIGVTVWE